MQKQFSTGFAGFNAVELRAVCEFRPGFGHVQDLRALGCPDGIFQRLVERRAKKLGLTPSPAALSDSQLRAKAAHLSEIIDAEKVADDIRSIYYKELSA